MIIHINRLIIFILNRLVRIIHITQLSIHFLILLINYLLNFILYCLVMISFIEHGLTSSTPYHRFAFPTSLFALIGLQP